MIGKKIKQLRVSLGMTQWEFAGKCNLNRSYVSDVENGRNTPTLDTLKKICASTGANLNMLVDDAEVVDVEVFKGTRAAIKKMVVNGKISKSGVMDEFSESFLYEIYKQDVKLFVIRNFDNILNEEM